jgi:hypothetical protein
MPRLEDYALGRACGTLGVPPDVDPGLTDYASSSRGRTRFLSFCCGARRTVSVIVGLLRSCNAVHLEFAAAR